MSKRKIFKYPLQTLDKQVIDLPVGAKILTVQTQLETPCIWVEVDPDEILLQGRVIYTRGTGHTFTGKHGKYLGTYQVLGGKFIYHVYIGDLV